MKLKLKRKISLVVCCLLCIALLGQTFSFAAYDDKKFDNAVGYAKLAEGDKELNGQLFESGKKFNLSVKLTNKDAKPIAVQDDAVCTLYRIDPEDEKSLETPSEMATFKAKDGYAWSAPDDFYVLLVLVEQGGQSYVSAQIFNVGKKDLEKGGICNYLQAILYTGKTVKTPMKVYFVLEEDKVLQEGVDYTVTYKNNKKIGTATATITGIGDYSGVLTIEFEIITLADYFDDVNPKGWYSDAISFVTYYGLFNGVSDTEFAPEDTMTRGMFVTVLSRLAGIPVDNKVTTEFVDVPKGKYYTGAVKWAAEEGIVKGVGANRFAPDEPITREMICKMMVTFSEAGGLALKEVKSPVTFKDADQISGWAKKYVKQCQIAGLVQGDNGYFNPQGKATRAEVATIFKNFCDQYLEYVFDLDDPENSGFFVKG